MEQLHEGKEKNYVFSDMYCEAAFCGSDAEGIRIHIENRQDENDILLFDEERNLKWICEIESDEISFPYDLFEGLETGRWIFYAGVMQGRTCVLKCMRNTGVKVPGRAKEIFFDKRELYGTAIYGKDQILLPNYGIGQELILEVCHEKKNIYRRQIRNEIISAGHIEETDSVLLYTRCKAIEGSYLGIIVKNEKELSEKKYSYEKIERCNGDVYMTFCFPYEDKNFVCDVAWRCHGEIYTAPLVSRDELPWAELKDFCFSDSYIEAGVCLNESRYGIFQRAVLVPAEDTWNHNLERQIISVKEEKENDVRKLKLCINSKEMLTTIGKWELQLCIKAGERQLRIPVLPDTKNRTLIEAIETSELFDYGDTTWKVVSGIDKGKWVIERKYGHNALFRKNCLSTVPDETLGQFLERPGIYPKGEMYGKWVCLDNRQMEIWLYQKMDPLIEAALVLFHTQGMGILHVQTLGISNGILDPVRPEVPRIDTEDRFPKPVNSFWFRVALALRTEKGIYFTFLKQYDLQVETIREGSLYDERNMYFPPIGKEKICSIPMSVVPYYAGNYQVSMKYVRPEQLYRSQFCNELLDVRIRHDVMNIRVRCRECGGIYKGVLMEYRKVKEEDAQTYLIPYESLKQEPDGTFIMTVKVDMKKYYMRMLYWDIRTAFEKDGVLYNVACYSNNRKFLKKYDGVFVDRTYPNENSIMFPYATANNSVALMHRETVPQDHWKFRLKEQVAIVLFQWLKKYWEKKNIYLVFEKYCTMAQDNGYYFFKYCMDADVEKKFPGHIYYVLDRKAADWEKILPYRKHVVPFLSLRHLIYLQACKLLISTDTKGHAYVWRSMGSAIKKLSYKKKLVFLQHGVTAFKRGHFEKGTNVGCEYFITTSQFEHDIICNYLGYLQEEVPVTGFARWDVLHDKSEGHREILMMPTWRSWLDDAENDVFAESDYCKNYMALLNDPRMDQILREQNVTLNFYLHPKFRKFITEFSVVSDHIRLIPFGEAPLNELMMECNMLITDFSSVAWDIYYMNKPVLFYHFDLEDANKTLGFYMDMEHDLFGERAETPEELMQLIIEYIGRDFKIKQKYADERSKYFAYVDDHNSERIWKAIREHSWE